MQPCGHHGRCLSFAVLPTTQEQSRRNNIPGGSRAWGGGIFFLLIKKTSPGGKSEVSCFSALAEKGMGGVVQPYRGWKTDRLYLRGFACLRYLRLPYALLERGRCRFQPLALGRLCRGGVRGAHRQRRSLSSPALQFRSHSS